MKFLVLSVFVLMGFLSFAQEEKKEIEYRLKADCSITKNEKNYGVHTIDLILREGSHIAASVQSRKTDFSSKYIETPNIVTSLERTSEELEDRDEFVFSVKNHYSKTHYLNISIIEYVIDNELDQIFVFPLDEGHNYNCRFFYYN